MTSAAAAFRSTKLDADSMSMNVTIARRREVPFYVEADGRLILYQLIVSTSLSFSILRCVR